MPHFGVSRCFEGTKTGVGFIGEDLEGEAD
jgi:hypothetical protein